MTAKFRIYYLNGKYSPSFLVYGKDVDTLWQAALNFTISTSKIQGMKTLDLIEIL